MIFVEIYCSFLQHSKFAVFEIEILLMFCRKKPFQLCCCFQFSSRTNLAAIDVGLFISPFLSWENNVEMWQNFEIYYTTYCFTFFWKVIHSLEKCNQLFSNRHSNTSNICKFLQTLSTAGRSEQYNQNCLSKFNL